MNDCANPFVARGLQTVNEFWPFLPTEKITSKIESG